MTPDELKMSPFECPVCLRLMHEPATLHCGHSLCGRCLVACMQHAARCPVCRVDLPPQMSFPATSFALQRALEQLFPDEWSAREAEEAAAPAAAGGSRPEGPASLPIFVLEPLLPRQRMQLHVFEPRYSLLIRSVLMSADCTFGMVAAEHTPPGFGGAAHPRPAAAGVLVKVLDCRPLPHGRYLVSIEGVRRIRVVRTWEVDDYFVAQAAWLADDPILDRERQAEAEALGVALGELLDEWAAEVGVGLGGWVGEVGGWVRWGPG